MQKKSFFTKSIAIIFIALFLNNCGIFRMTDARVVSPDPDERIKKNMEEGKGIRFSEFGKNKGTNFQFASSNPLWRATLDILDWAPLANVDYAGGLIVTDWYSEKESNDEIKITIRFLSNEIRADGLKVLLHSKNCTQNNKCSVSKIKSELSSEIKLEILKKAALLQEKDLQKKRKQIGKYRIPGFGQRSKGGK